MSRFSIFAMTAAGSFGCYLFLDTKIESTIVVLMVSAYTLLVHWFANK